MKVIALVSGGKDSCFNMILCQHYGHEVVALANLLPTQEEVDELDSYMYQTVGHQIVAAYASCMGLPLYRRKILGASKDQRLVYEDTAGDEVEDLAALLAYIKSEIPDVGAVSSGAIASDYQRTRVERVCSRLGLVSLAYLWHQPQDPLLQRMIDAEIEAVLVKVAAAGLNPRHHLGASLAQVQPHLRSLRKTYGCNICGEGGEYETMTLDCPIFTQGRIILDAWDTVHVSEDSMAPVALLHPTEFHVASKSVDKNDGKLISNGINSGNGEEALVIEVPDEYMAVFPTEINNNSNKNNKNFSVKFRQSSGASGCQSITAEVLGASSDTRITDTLHTALQTLADALSTQKLTWHDALFIHLYVADMAQFGAANAVYSNFLPAINPPARACVQLAAAAASNNTKSLEDEGEEQVPSLVVEVLLRSNTTKTSPTSGTGNNESNMSSRISSEKKVLHVQSISEWAPSCIGPYSQAVAHQGLVYFAGQIPLDPPTMQVATEDPAAATERSLSSCQAVAVAMRTDLRLGSLWWTVYTSSKVGDVGREAVEERIHAFLAGEKLDERKNTAKEEGPEAKIEDQEGSEEGNDDDIDEDALFVDDYLLPPAMPQRHWEPLVTFIEMPELPRGVVVEVQPVAWSSYGNPVEDSSSSDSDSSDSDHGDEGAGKRKKTFFNGPYWVGQLQSKRMLVNGPAGHAELHILQSPGNLFKGNAFVMDIAAGSNLNEAAKQATAGLLQEMMLAETDDGSLTRKDIITAKIYLPVAELDNATVGAIRKAVDEEIMNIQADSTLDANVDVDGVAVVVPVLRVGPNSESNSLLCIELFARK